MDWIKAIPKWLFAASFTGLIVLLVVLYISGKELRYKDGISFIDPNSINRSQNLSPSQIIIQGRVSENGTADGEDFNSRRTRTGEYVITYAREFAGTPTVVATVAAADQYIGQRGDHPADTVINVMTDATKATIWTYGINSDGKAIPSNVEVSFIAIGKPR
ncbi:MAG: hypothetical protein PF503_14695 [Desulfobacula sp.]|jgi:hypothetical protein|nr:hypothetical protein [Desulfobacula sp.]